MKPEDVQKFFETMWAYVAAFFTGLIMPVYRWFDDKKTAIGAMFFFVKEWLVEPYYEKVLHTLMPSTVDFYLAAIAAIFTLTGVTHSGIRFINNRRNGVIQNGKKTTRPNID